MEEEEEEAAAAGGRVLLALPGVAVPVSLPPRPLRGNLRVLRGPQDLVLQWEPLERPWEPPGDADPPDPGFEPDWAVLSPPRPRPDPGWAGGFSLALGELRGLRRGPPGLSPPFLLLLPRDGGPAPPPLHLPRGGLRKIRRVLGSRLRPCPGDPRLLLLATPEDPPETPPEPGLVTRLLQGPYAATLGGLSRLLGGPRGETPEPEPPFEVLTCVTLGPRPSPVRGSPLAGADWGRGLDPEVLRERIFRGGLSSEVRARGWRLLLGLEPGGDPQRPPGSPKIAPGTPKGQRDDYFRMKLQWRSLSPGQLRRNKILRGVPGTAGAGPGPEPPLGSPLAAPRCSHDLLHVQLRPRVREGDE
ncbi:TBC1 domain family member 17 [Poecile atricapillus]|uniref:TBC1 domain family member 17 n=1 Tax=Poecile atricapillus TaxID=48891 RepID=UPI0027385567|nr:TBC1 domain family member 17 [Poecile atricapillus]